MRTLILSTLLCAPLGGTLLEIPLDEASPGKAEELAKRFQEVPIAVLGHTCASRESRVFRYDACVDCGAAFKIETETVALDVRDNVLSVGHGGRGPLCVLRLSAIEKILQEAGVKPIRGKFLDGHFALHVSGGKAKEFAVEVGMLDGVDDFHFSENVVYVNQERSRPVEFASLQKIAREQEVKIDDISWVLSRCMGKVGFTNKK
ncbi:MAG: hypothetical protein HYY16_04670 [Planctomycetes bacterium]|nr:hypothetical protein [Planctomycetota bacterium]